MEVRSVSIAIVIESSFCTLRCSIDYLSATRCSERRLCLALSQLWIIGINLLLLFTWRLIHIFWWLIDQLVGHIQLFQRTSQNYRFWIICASHFFRDHVLALVSNTTRVSSYPVALVAEWLGRLSWNPPGFTEGGSRPGAGKFFFQ